MPPTRPANANAYWEQIERYFTQKRGSALILSPKDWPLVASWQERGLTLDVIFEGIDNAFTRLAEQSSAASSPPIRTLTACARDVEAAWDAWKERHPEWAQQEQQHARAADCRKLAAKLRSTAHQLRTCADQEHYRWIRDPLLATSDSLDAQIPRLEHVQDDKELTAIRARIRDLEHQLTAQLEQTIDAETRQRLSAKAAARLASHKHDMSDAIYQETLRIAFLQELHEAYPLPSFI
ncbi:hypothetical protein GF339_02615 [candidate division KSB3 bacterium]|uniref:Uncharacterized protein n=1 Tax=candidate division KSB3 bacterium TaxID=2044937 RepID=A0A9D5JSH8_9BACT|nr:hypothetical protein [candidate division KSB3 bacterium]MBD3323447.1 hypothetical protein [candidate division KSB3 bacterium]